MRRFCCLRPRHADISEPQRIATAVNHCDKKNVEFQVGKEVSATECYRREIISQPLHPQNREPQLDSSNETESVEPCSPMVDDDCQTPYHQTKNIEAGTSQEVPQATQEDVSQSRTILRATSLDSLQRSCPPSPHREITQRPSSTSLQALQSLLNGELSGISLVSSDGTLALTSNASIESDILAGYLPDILDIQQMGLDLSLKSLASQRLGHDLCNLTPLGSGGCGVVYEGSWNGSHVAAKLIVSNDAEMLQLNVLEAIIERRLSHPHVVHTYVAGVIPIDHAWVMMNVSGMPRASASTVDRAVDQLFSEAFEFDRSTPGHSEFTGHNVVRLSEYQDPIQRLELGGHLPIGSTVSAHPGPLRLLSFGDDPEQVPQIKPAQIAMPSSEEAKVLSTQSPVGTDGYLGYSSIGLPSTSRQSAVHPLDHTLLEESQCPNQDSCQSPETDAKAEGFLQINTNTSTAANILGSPSPISSDLGVNALDVLIPHNPEPINREHYLDNGARKACEADLLSFPHVTFTSCLENSCYTPCPKPINSETEKFEYAEPVLPENSNASYQANLNLHSLRGVDVNFSGLYPEPPLQMPRQSREAGVNIVKEQNYQLQQQLPTVLFSSSQSTTDLSQGIGNSFDIVPPPTLINFKQEVSTEEAGQEEADRTQTSTREYACENGHQQAQQRETDSNRAVSKESMDFFLGNSIGKGALAFNDALRMMDLQPGQYVTCILMEHCDRGSLTDAIKRQMFQRSLKWGSGTAFKALVRTAHELAQGLAYLHSVNIVHGNLKPSNVLLKSSRLDRRGFTVKLSDFEDASAEGINPLVYTAPEAIEGPLTTASDVWSFGVILFEMVTGEHPYPKRDWGELLADLLSGQAQPEWPASLHLVLKRLGESCTCQDPNMRPSAPVICKVMVRIEESLKQGGTPRPSINPKIVQPSPLSSRPSWKPPE